MKIVGRTRTFLLAASCLLGCDGALRPTTAPPAAGSPEGSVIIPPDSGPTGTFGTPTCASGQCLGADGVCYGPCAVGSCTQVPSGTCGPASPGRVYCCTGGGAAATVCGGSTCDGIFTVTCPGGISINGACEGPAVDQLVVSGTTATLTVTGPAYVQYPGEVDTRTCTVTAAYQTFALSPGATLTSECGACTVACGTTSSAFLPESGDCTSNGVFPSSADTGLCCSESVNDAASHGSAGCPVLAQHRRGAVDVAASELVERRRDAKSDGDGFAERTLHGLPAGFHPTARSIRSAGYSSAAT